MAALHYAIEFAQHFARICGWRTELFYSTPAFGMEEPDIPVSSSELERTSSESEKFYFGRLYNTASFLEYINVQKGNTIHQAMDDDFTRLKPIWQAYTEADVLLDRAKKLNSNDVSNLQQQFYKAAINACDCMDKIIKKYKSVCDAVCTGKQYEPVPAFDTENLPYAVLEEGSNGFDKPYICHVYWKTVAKKLTDFLKYISEEIEYGDYKIENLAYFFTDPDTVMLLNTFKYQPLKQTACGDDKKWEPLTADEKNELTALGREFFLIWQWFLTELCTKSGRSRVETRFFASAEEKAKYANQLQSYNTLIAAGKQASPPMPLPAENSPLPEGCFRFTSVSETYKTVIEFRDLGAGCITGFDDFLSAFEKLAKKILYEDTPEDRRQTEARKLREAYNGALFNSFIIEKITPSFIPAFRKTRSLESNTELLPSIMSAPHEDHKKNPTEKADEFNIKEGFLNAAKRAHHAAEQASVELLIDRDFVYTLYELRRDITECTATRPAEADLVNNSWKEFREELSSYLSIVFYETYESSQIYIILQDAESIVKNAGNLSTWRNLDVTPIAALITHLEKAAAEIFPDYKFFIHQLYNHIDPKGTTAPSNGGFKLPRANGTEIASAKARANAAPLFSSQNLLAAQQAQNVILEIHNHIPPTQVVNNFNPSISVIMPGDDEQIIDEEDDMEEGEESRGPFTAFTRKTARGKGYSLADHKAMDIVFEHLNYKTAGQRSAPTRLKIWHIPKDVDENGKIIALQDILEAIPAVALKVQATDSRLYDVLEKLEARLDTVDKIQKYLRARQRGDYQRKK